MSESRLQRSVATMRENHREFPPRQLPARNASSFVLMEQDVLIGSQRSIGFSKFLMLVLDGRLGQWNLTMDVAKLTLTYEASGDTSEFDQFSETGSAHLFSAINSHRSVSDSELLILVVVDKPDL